MKRKGLIALGLAILALVVLVALFPASWAWRLVGEKPAPLQIGQIRGSVWHGRAEGVSYAGIELGTLRWRLSPAQLWGRTDLHLLLKGDLAHGKADITRRGDTLTGRDVHLEVTVDTLPVTLGTPPMHPRGTLVIDIARVELHDGWPRALMGHIVWQDAALADRFDTVPLGDLRADLSERDGSVLEAKLSDDGGPLALSGTVEASTLGWRVNAVLRARKDTPLMHRVIAQLGQPSSDGSLHLDMHGGLTLGARP